MNLHTYLKFCAAKAYKWLQKNTRQVFSDNLSSILIVYKLINSKEMTQTITFIQIFVHEINVLKNVF